MCHRRAWWQRGQLRGQGSLAGLALLAVVMSPAKAPQFGALSPTMGSFYCTVVRGPRNRVVGNSAKSVVAFVSDSTDQETQAAGNNSLHSGVSRAVLFQDGYFFPFFSLLFKSCLTDPRSENEAMFAGVAFAFQPRWSGSNTWTRPLDNNTDSSFQPIAVRQKQYDLGQPNIWTDMIGVH